MELVRPGQQHIQTVLAGLRESDRAELYALSRAEPEAALLACLGASVFAWAMLNNGRAVALTGVCRNDDGSGAPWLVGTDEIAAAPLAFMRASKRAIEIYRASFSRLVNYVEVGQCESVRYVEALGFRLGEVKRIGAGDFYKFYME